MGLNLAERSFLQCMIGAGALSEKKATALFNACTENAGVVQSQKIHNDGRELNERLGHVNTYIGAYNLQFSAAFHANETYWGLTNTGRDDAVSQATSFSPSELTLFFALKDLIMASGGSVSQTDAHNLGPGANLRVADAARAIGRLVSMQWLRVVRRGAARIEFGPRTLIELPDVRAWARKKDGEDFLKEEVEMGSAEEKEEEIVDEETKSPSRRPPSQRRTRSKRILAVDGEEGNDEEARHMRSSQAAGSQVLIQDDDDEVIVVHVKRGRRKRRVR